MINKFDKIAAAGKALNLLSRAGRTIKNNLPSWKSTALLGGGALGGAAAAISAPAIAQKAREISTLSANKGALEFTDASKTTLRWKTYPGGPILEGPKDEMIRVIRLGKQNREEGIKVLLSLIKSGVIRKVGTV